MWLTELATRAGAGGDRSSNGQATRSGTFWVELRQQRRIEGEDMQLVKERGEATMGLSDGSAGD